MLSTMPILWYPWFDLPFIYSTDALFIAVGATLLLDLGLELLPFCYANRKLSSAELRFFIEDREFLDIVFATVKLLHYLTSGPKWVVCLTDHEPLKYLYSKRDLNKR